LFSRFCLESRFLTISNFPPVFLLATFSSLDVSSIGFNNLTDAESAAKSPALEDLITFSLISLLSFLSLDGSIHKRLAVLFNLSSFQGLYNPIILFLNPSLSSQPFHRVFFISSISPISLENLASNVLTSGNSLAIISLSNLSLKVLSHLFLTPAVASPQFILSSMFFLICCNCSYFKTQGFLPATAVISLSITERALFAGQDNSGKSLIIASVKDSLISSPVTLENFQTNSLYQLPVSFKLIEASAIFCFPISAISLSLSEASLPALSTVSRTSSQLLPRSFKIVSLRLLNKATSVVLLQTFCSISTNISSSFPSHFKSLSDSSGFFFNNSSHSFPDILLTLSVSDEISFLQRVGDFFIKFLIQIETAQTQSQVSGVKNSPTIVAVASGLAPKAN
tara:strand:- start:5 stop:1192 length:1188 start_codon:yes stop_codon:yes gene_type:complete